MTSIARSKEDLHSEETDVQISFTIDKKQSFNYVSNNDFYKTQYKFVIVKSQSELFKEAISEILNKSMGENCILIFDCYIKNISYIKATLQQD